MRTMTFAVRDGLPLTLDFWRSNAPDPRPLVVFIHGGGWISGDKSHFAEEAAWLATEGYACAAIEYRLAPLHPYPAAVLDAQAAVAYCRANAGELGIDPERVASFGSSAGGHLAAMVGLLDAPVRPDSTLEASPTTNLVVSICGIHRMDDPDRHHLPIAFGFLEAFMGSSYRGNEALWTEAGPHAHVRPGAPPFYLAHGDADDVVPIAHSLDMKAALDAAGVEAELAVFEGEGHGFTLPAYLEMRDQVRAFLRRHFGV